VLHRLTTPSFPKADRVTDVTQIIKADDLNAKHPQAQAFYKKYGFIEFTENPLTLFIQMRSVLQSLPAV